MSFDAWLAPSSVGAAPAPAAASGRAYATFDVVNAITADPSAVAALSAPSRIDLNTLRITYEQVARSPIGAMTADVAAKVGEQVIAAAGDVSVNIAAALPVVGQIFQAVVAVVQLVSNAQRAEEQAEEAYCQEFFRVFPIPAGTGSMLAGGLQVPADIFARIHKPESWRSGGWSARYRSWLGQALMRITEGDIIDHASDVDWSAMAAGTGKTAKQVQHEAVQKSSRELKRLNVAFEGGPWKHAHPGPANGVPASRRAQFRKLRRAIEASYGPHLPPGTYSDGGVSLWPVYLDLLLHEFDAQHLTAGYAGYLLTHYVHWYPEGPEVRELGWFGVQGSHCYERVVDAVVNLLRQWRQSIHPFYGPGIAKMAELEKQAAAIAGQPKAIGLVKLGPVLKPKTLGEVARSQSRGRTISILAVLGLVAAAAAKMLFPR